MTTQTLDSHAARPWYRERWPWLLMIGPAAAVIGGIITAYIAVTHQDGLVAEDYYKQGLAINRTLDKERTAGRLGLSAQLAFSDDATRLRVYINGTAGTPGPLKLRLAHATRAGLDQTLMLDRNPGGWYEGRMNEGQAAGKWKVLLEDGTGQWRLTGEWHAGTDATVVLDPRTD